MASISRRSFLTSALAAGAAVAGWGIGGMLPIAGVIGHLVGPFGISRPF